MGDDDNEEQDGAPVKNNVVRVDFAAKKQKPPMPQLKQPPSSSELGPERPEKLRMFARLIERGMVMITADARRDNARVPNRLAGDLELKLNFSHKFGVGDFFYDDDGVRASLSFGGQAFYVDIPWTAVYGMLSHVDGERMIWPDSLPEELKALLPPQARHAIVDDAGVDATGDAGADEDGDEPPPPKPTLRRVK